MMDEVKMIPMLSIVFLVSTIILAAAAMTLGSFGETMTRCSNTSYSYSRDQGNCTYAALPTEINSSTVTIEYDAILKGQQGNAAITEQLPIVAIIAVMVVIIAVIASVFVYFKYFG